VRYRRRCRSDIRRHLKTFTRRTIARLVVLSMSEVPHQIALRSFGMVGVEPHPSANATRAAGLTHPPADSKPASGTPVHA
jgi:flagellar biosynthesis protein FlhA